MRSFFKIVLSVGFCSILCISTVFAHGGRTDAYEGHRDNYNASGLGSYHYHCGSAPAHLHDNGICPYVYTETYAPDPEPTYTPPVQTEKPTISDLNSAGRKDDRYVVEAPSYSPLNAVVSMLVEFLPWLLYGGFAVALIGTFLGMIVTCFRMERFAKILEKITTLGFAVGMLAFLFPILGGMAFVSAIFAIPGVFKKLFSRKP